MKELSIEEKATRYDDVIRRAIVVHKDEDRQRDQLEEAMVNAGYSRKAQTKKLIEVYKQLKEATGVDEDEEKSNWSEEDEYMLDETINHLKQLIELEDRLLRTKMKTDILENRLKRRCLLHYKHFIMI